MREIEASKVGNIKAIRADIRARLPLADNIIDSCLMATIIHDLPVGDQNLALQEAARLVKPGGILNIIEFKKIDKGPGPPIEIRLTEDDIDRIVTSHGFTKVLSSEIGDFNYLTHGSLQVDISKARDLLGWNPPVTVDEGLKRTVTWVTVFPC